MVLEFLESAARVATDPIGSITSAQGAIPALLPGAPFFLTRVRLRPSTRTGSFHHMLDGLRRSLVSFGLAKARRFLPIVSGSFDRTRRPVMRSCARFSVIALTLS